MVLAILGKRLPVGKKSFFILLILCNFTLLVIKDNSFAQEDASVDCPIEVIIDVDQDNVDDSCDLEITEPPAEETPPEEIDPNNPKGLPITYSNPLGSLLSVTEAPQTTASAPQNTTPPSTHSSTTSIVVTDTAPAESLDAESSVLGDTSTPAPETVASADEPIKPIKQSQSFPFALILIPLTIVLLVTTGFAYKKSTQEITED